MVWPHCDERLATTIRAAQQGDPEAIEMLVVAFREDVSSACRKFGLAHVSHLSQSDVIQEAWIRIWSRLGSFRGGDSPGNTLATFSGWIQKTAENVGINILRSEKAQKRGPVGGAWHNVETIIQPDQKSPSSAACAAEHELAVRSAVQELPEDLKNVIECCILRSISVKDAAQKLGITYETARYRLTVAISRLKHLLDSKDD